MAKFVLVTLFGLADATRGIPAVNVIVEGLPGGGSLDPALSEVAQLSGEAVALAGALREGQHHMRDRTEAVLRAQSSEISVLKASRVAGAAGFLAATDARSDAGKLAMLLADVAGSVGPQPSGELAQAGFKVPESERELRKLLLDAGKAFGDVASDDAAHALASPTSFLQPVDASRLRGSLEVTEPMRAPAPMAVNVIMQEDLLGMQRMAAAKGAAQQVQRLTADFETDLAALTSA